MEYQCGSDEDGHVPEAKGPLSLMMYCRATEAYSTGPSAAVILGEHRLSLLPECCGVGTSVNVLGAVPGLGRRTRPIIARVVISVDVRRISEGPRLGRLNNPFRSGDTESGRVDRQSLRKASTCHPRGPVRFCAGPLFLFGFQEISLKFLEHLQCVRDDSSFHGPFLFLREFLQNVVFGRNAERFVRADADAETIELL